MYIKIDKINKIYTDNHSKEVKVIDDFNLDIEKGEFLCILGVSGCGKTTLLNLLAGFEQATTGKIYIDGKEVDGPSPNCIMTFQNFGLLPWRTVQKNVELGLEAKRIDKKKIKEIANQYIEMVGLSKFKKYHPSQLSSGMQQRVAIARALCVEPEVILMDEPLGALDSITRMKMQDEILNIWEKKKNTIIFVTHDIDESVYLADRIVIMTPHFGKIKAIIDVDLPRRRDRTSIEFLKFIDKVFVQLGLNK
ncbi:MAG: ABC transporter [Spirochaetes bacterium GWD1_27_9]|nr:MAG: ABC transporter [Spirochaetes bacterium GWC1_27_15]OHD43864.1 MAG: ABC transporter [Spirochaetes bacterium GWD1_27_9]